MITRRRLARGILAASGLLFLGLVVVALGRSSLSAPPPTVLLRDRHDRFLGEVGQSGPDGELGYWSVGELPARVVAATVAVEDHRFYRHPGVDPLSIARAVGQNVRHLRRVSGASTLAMQVARMQNAGGRSYLRKAVEAMTALFLTLRHGRQGVLAHYLTIVPYGNRIHGIEYAARRYLDKPVCDLSWAETAFLTAIPQSPAHMNPFEPDGRARAIERGRRILRLLRKTGALDKAEYQLATAEISRLRIPPHGERPESALHLVLRFGADISKMEKRPRVLVTTLDLGLQDRVTALARSAVLAREAQGAGNACVAVVDRASGEVLAWVSSTGYGDAGHAGAIDYTRVPRSPGSALKPFLYALALEKGAISPATVLDDLARGSGGITNADDLFLGPLLPRVALANSRNVPAADLLDRVGLEEGYGFLRDLGLHDGARAARTYGLGLAIGGLPTTLERLVRAYTVLANEGRLTDLAWTVGARPARPRRVLSEETARLVTLFLSDPMARLPTFPRMGATEYPFPVAVKTGTSSRYRDAWTVAWSPRYLVAAWVGHPDFRPMHRVSGYRAAAELTQRVLSALHESESAGLADLSFPPPAGFAPHRLCALSGRLAGPACDRVFLEWIREGQEPVDACAVHVALAVDRRSGLLASRKTPRRDVEVRTFVDLPPRYAAWAAAAGLPRPPLSPFASNATVPSTGAPAALPLTPQTTARVHITSPENGVSLLRDPETPPENATVALRAVADPPVSQLVWYVDGQPWRTVDYPYVARWTLIPGEHTFQARLPFQGLASRLVRVRVP